MRYEPRPWERVEDGILYGPGYVVDLETDDVLFFVSPSAMRSGRSRRVEDVGIVERGEGGVTGGLRVVLYEGELQPGTQTYQGVSVSACGDLAFEAQDVGAVPRELWGDSDYEWFVTVAAADKPRVLEALRSEHPDFPVEGEAEGEGDAELLGLLHAVYGGRPDAVDAVRHWLDEKSIPYEFSSWV